MLFFFWCKCLAQFKKVSFFYYSFCTSGEAALVIIVVSLPCTTYLHGSLIVLCQNPSAPQFKSHFQCSASIGLNSITAQRFNETYFTGKSFVPAIL